MNSGILLSAVLALTTSAMLGEDSQAPLVDVILKIEEVRFSYATLVLNEKHFELKVSVVSGGESLRLEDTIVSASYPLHGFSLYSDEVSTPTVKEGDLVRARVPSGATRIFAEHIVSNETSPGGADMGISPLKIVEIWVVVGLLSFLASMFAIYKQPKYATLRKLMAFAFVYKGTIALVVVLMVLTNLAQFAPVAFTEDVLDRVIWKKDFSLLTTIVIALVIAAMLHGVFEYYSEYLYRLVMLKTTMDVRCALVSRIIRFDMGTLSRSRVGELISRTTNDITQTQIALRFVFGEFLRQPIMVVMGISYAFLMCPPLALIVFVVFPLCFIPVSILARRINRNALKGLEKLAEVTDHMQQAFSGVRIIKAFSLEGLEDEEFRDVNKEHLRRSLKVSQAKALSKAIIFAITGIGAALIILVGCYLVFGEYFGLTIGRLFAFIGATAIIYKPARALVKEYNDMQEALAGTTRIFQLMETVDQNEDKPGAAELESVKREIRFENVTFSYDGENDVIHGLDFSARKGQTTALVGKSGHGKSTTLDLLARFYNPRGGSITIDGVDLRNLTRESILRCISIVTQDAFLFNTTIRENIRFGRLEATAEEVEAAAKAANIHNEIVDFPKGYETFVGERGTNLSGGQRQRITIARAILKEAPILLLDEATSALDSESERLVQTALDELMKGRTTFVIAHRLSTIMHADQILVINEGKVAAIGTHDELLSNSELYRELAQRDMNA
ncbi:MAG: ABC transporter ATP-binding protein/permease [Planctomycetes bacterium]|nr:ABC transporter ATP-binding protein/permease [Planctomycetota bacterium]